MFAERTGYIVWFSDSKAARGLDKYGTLHYLSRKMHYAVMYMNSEVAEETVRTARWSDPTATRSKPSTRKTCRTKRAFTVCKSGTDSIERRCV